MGQQFDLIVIGLGHAGCEAALAAARMGLSVLGLTLALDRIGLMSCNPSVGGPGKGALVRELDALGGEMAGAVDTTGTHFRILNEGKGPAVRARRAICDRLLYAREMGRRLAAQPGLTLAEGEVFALEVEGGRLVGLRTSLGELSCRAAIVTAGTFLCGTLHIGAERREGGRLGDRAATALSDSLRQHGVRLERFKTGTPARLDGRTIDYGRTQPQSGDPAPVPFSFATLGAGCGGTFPALPQQACALTHTNERTHQLIRENLHRSSLYGGAIVGRGPRYCPSIEDKVVRFAHRERHLIFLERDGADSNLIYPAGISTSLPAEIQLAFMRTIAGLEEVELIEPGYAVEYDYASPTQLDRRLALRHLEGLWLAGQVNGTSGYEEAAVQGLVAGINAALWVRSEPPFLLSRAESLIGVLIDDLVGKGVAEPYRMFTSRAEHRILLREENADLRLVHHAARLGLCSAQRLAATEEKGRAIEAEVARLERLSLNPTAELAELFAERGWVPLRAPTSLATILRRPELSYEALAPIDRPCGWFSERHPSGWIPPAPLPSDALREVETRVRYSGYLEREALEVERAERNEALAIPAELDFLAIPGFAREVAERLNSTRPLTLGQASRVSGMTPAAASLLAIHLLRLAKRGGDGGAPCGEAVGTVGTGTKGEGSRLNSALEATENLCKTDCADRSEHDG